jgi:diguanylate cyclase (GGDEF)-like protein/PAS domain S-box-containing protein
VAAVTPLMPPTHAFGAAHTRPDAAAILSIPTRYEAFAVIFDTTAAGNVDPRFSEACLSAVLESSPLGILISDSTCACLYSNRAYQSISGLTAGESSGKHWIAPIHPDDRQLALSAWRNSTSDQASPWHDVRLSRPDGGVRQVRLHIVALRERDLTNVRYVHTIEDISARREAEDALHAVEESLLEQNERAQVTLDSIGDAVLTTDRLGNVLYLNRVAETLTGWSHESALGRPIAKVFDIVDGETRRQAANPAQRAMAENKTVGLAIGCLLRRPDGTELEIEDSAAPIHDRGGRVSGAVIVFREASQSRTITERMAYLAQHDFLTGLPNRVLLRERLAQAIGLARRHDKAVGVLYLDLDNFKQVNDSLGHEKGDGLLRAVANRLLTSVRATDTVCREGGDEFVILLSELARPGDANDVARKVRAAFGTPLLVDGREFRVTASIGISLFPQDGDSAEAMLREADTAMYRAKADGAGRRRDSPSNVRLTALHRRQTGDAPRAARSALEPSIDARTTHSI